MANPVLLTLVMLAVAFRLAVWLSPRALNYYGARMVARAAALEASRMTYQRVMLERLGAPKEA
jgi:hypothetical protein